MLRAPCVGLVAAALSLSGCPSRKPPGEATSAASSAASTSISASPSIAQSAAADAGTSPDASASEPSPLTRVSWRALVGAEAWALAATSIDALPKEEQARVEVRLARARVGVGVCSIPEATRALAELAMVREDAAAKAIDDVLSRLEVDALVCAERWKDALAVTGPAGLAARSGGAAERTLARALEAVGDVKGARDAISKAIVDGPKAGLSVGALLAYRLRLDRAAADANAISADRKRLFVAFPSAFADAVKQGESSDPPTLSADEWLQRADALAAGGDADGALLAIDEAAKLSVPARKIARARGAALYKARAYPRAAVALADAAKLAPPPGDDDALDDAFHAARATSRGGDDAAAIVAYDALAKASPRSHYGVEAAFLGANLRYLRGDWKDAIDALDRFLASPGSKDKAEETNAREARRARAISLLANGDARATKALDDLARSDAYDKDSFAQGRVLLLEAISLERVGDRAAEIAQLRKLQSGSFSYGYLDVAARRRLSALGETSTPWPTGPIARSSPALPAPADFLHLAGLDRDARAALHVPAIQKSLGDDATRCASYDEVDAGYDEYLLGLHVDASQPPASSGWAWRCAYPTPYAEVVDALESREHLPHGLLHALLRQESGFRVEVISPAGAVGIAQLMPATAVTTAATIGVSLDPADIAGLESPFLQLDLAARHVHSLFVELGGEGDETADPQRLARTVPLVIAAYNAGAGSVKRWIADAGTLDADVWIERIPFIETRAYTARVLGNLVRYAIIAGGAPPELPAKFAP